MNEPKVLDGKELAPQAEAESDQQVKRPMDERDLQPRRGFLSRKAWMCTAHLSDGSGRLCTKAKAHGSEVCETHGAGASQVKLAAKRRFEELVPTAQQAVSELLVGDHAPSKLGAAKEVFDRALGPTKTAGETGSGLVINLGVWGSPDPEQAIAAVEVIDVTPEPQPED